jgi:hypothetical protein
VTDLAANFSAYLIFLEHRYYGLSQPYEDLSDEHMVHLNIKEALEDHKYFITSMNNGVFKDVTDPKWMTVGGSYPGALSAWTRHYNKDLITAAWSSSGVINAITDFTDYDRQVYLSSKKSGDWCPEMLHSIVKYIDYMVDPWDPTKEPLKTTMARLNAPPSLTRFDFTAFVGDMWAGMV